MSYGKLGNAQIAPYLFYEQVNPRRANFVIDGMLPTYISSPGVVPDDFTWETSISYNLGIDIDLFSNKLSSSIDVYKRNTVDMITAGGRPPLPSVFGASAPLSNFGELESKGFEVTIQYRNQINFSKKLKYSFRLTLSDNVGKITKVGNPEGLFTTVNAFVFETGNYYEGQRVGDLWGLVTDGFFQSEDEIQAHADQSAIVVSAGNIPLPGDVKFKDLNGDDIINYGSRTLDDHGDLTIIGNTLPRYSYGINGDVEWNNFSLFAFFQGIGKRDWYPSYGSEFWGQYSGWYAPIPIHTYENRWTPENPDSYFPRYKGPMPRGNRQLQAQTKYLQDVSYIRLKNLTISYSLPIKITKKLNIDNLNIYFSGENIWTYSPIHKLTKSIDPESIESSYGNFNGNDYPILKSYSFGLKFSL